MKSTFLALVVLAIVAPIQANAEPAGPLMRALSDHHALRLVQAKQDCLKYCQGQYPCGNQDINSANCSKLKACMESCG